MNLFFYQKKKHAIASWQQSRASTSRHASPEYGPSSYTDTRPPNVCTQLEGAETAPAGVQVQS